MFSLPIIPACLGNENSNQRRRHCNRSRYTQLCVFSTACHKSPLPPAAMNHMNSDIRHLVSEKTSLCTNTVTCCVIYIYSSNANCFLHAYVLSVRFQLIHVYQQANMFTVTSIYSRIKNLSYYYGMSLRKFCLYSSLNEWNGALNL